LYGKRAEMYQVLFCVISIISICYAQINPFLQPKLMLEKIKLPEKEDEILPDNGIDPETYIIGQGDQFTAYAINSPAIVFTGQVTLESDVFIPEIGLIKVGPTTLNNAKKIINKRLVETVKGKDVGFFISLTKMKSSTFAVGGCVLKPGTYTMRGKYRVFDAIEKANIDSNFLSVPNINLREVLLVNNHDTLNLDMYEYLYKNNLLSNPYVFPGQNIYVSFKTSKIKIDGPIKNGLVGEIPIKKNETLKSILNLCVLDESADKGSILVKKASNEEIIETNYAQSDSIILEDCDQITILRKPSYPIFQTVSIKGEVSRPGNYSINNKETTLKQLMKLAGGITEYADLERSCIIRRKNNPTENLTALINPSITLSINPEIQTSLRKMGSFKDYSVLRFNSENDSLLLTEDDIIFIPKIDHNIYVSGNVGLPGVIAFTKNMSISDCIKAAGGLANDGDKSKAYVITVYPENIMVIKDRNKIEPGDIIIVPEKQKYRVFSTVFMPVLSAVLSTISIAWMIYSN
jgi:protein involved in polysaccharide export with SLBB domain